MPYHFPQPLHYFVFSPALTKVPICPHPHHHLLFSVFSYLLKCHLFDNVLPDILLYPQVEGSCPLRYRCLSSSPTSQSTRLVSSCGGLELCVQPFLSISLIGALIQATILSHLILQKPLNYPLAPAPLLSTQQPKGSIWAGPAGGANQDGSHGARPQSASQKALLFRRLRHSPPPRAALT